jgi:hypothetical protein
MKSMYALRLTPFALAAICVLTLAWFGASGSVTDYVTQMTAALQTP